MSLTDNDIDGSQPLIEEAPEEFVQPKRALIADICDISELQPSDDGMTPIQTPVEENIPQTIPNYAGISIKNESVQVNVEEEIVKTPITEEVCKKKLQRGISSSKEKVVDVELAVEDHVKKIKVEKVKEEVSCRGVKEVEEELDDELEALLSRAKRQRSLIEDVSFKSETEGKLFKYIKFSSKRTK